MIILLIIERTMSLPSFNKPNIVERLLAVASYLTTGFVGAIWLIIAALTKKQISNFVMYHIFQSIFLSITYYVVTLLATLLVVIISRIPLINQIPIILNSSIPIFGGLSLIQTLTTIILIYLVLTSFCGLYSYIPWVSDVVRGNTRR